MSIKHLSPSAHPGVQAGESSLRHVPVDTEYLVSTLWTLLGIPSPSGYTDSVVRWLGEELERLGVPFELSRRGGMRATLRGRGARHKAMRAVVSHVDTLGAMVRQLKPNGRLAITPIGHWSSRFAEGARVTVFTDTQGTRRGTVLPLKASGHTFNKEIDTQPVTWENVEIRTDDFCTSGDELGQLGYNIGDFVAFDPCPELNNNFIVSRHLDNKAGVASMLAAIRAVVEGDVELPVDCHMIFTISEEVGTGASAILHGDVAEMVAVDNATPAPGQNSRERGVTVAMADSTGPFDYHLTHRLLGLCQRFQLEHQRDVFKYYRCDAASAIEAGNDMRVALACFGADGSHGYERTHVTALSTLAELLALYVQTDLAVARDRRVMGPLKGFPQQPE